MTICKRPSALHRWKHASRSNWPGCGGLVEKAVVLVFALVLCFLFLPTKAAFSEVTEPQAGMKLAYLILVHEESTVRSGCKLLRTIYRPDFYYLFLVDQNTPRVWQCHLQRCVEALLLQTQSNNTNVVLQVTTNASGWGSLGLIQNELDGMQTLFEWSSQWTYLLVLSGDTYPLVSQEELVSRLSEEPFRNYVTTWGYGINRRPDQWYRLRHLHHWPEEVTEVVFGTQWITVTRELVQFALRSSFARNLLAAFGTGKVRIGDELFFQMLIWNDEYFRSTLRTSSSRIARFEKWTDCTTGRPGALRRYPCYLGEDDFEAIQSSGSIFARKIEFNISSALYPLIDRELLHQTTFPVSFDYDEKFQDCQRTEETTQGRHRAGQQSKLSFQH